jgi:hypothetical protein
MGASGPSGACAGAAAAIEKEVRKTDEFVVATDAGRKGVVSLAEAMEYGRLADMRSSRSPYRGFRFPPERIEHVVWLYHCFSLSLRDVESILAARGVTVSYEGMTRPMQDFMSFWSAAITVAGIEIVHMIRKGQMPSRGVLPPAEQFYSLAE